IIEDGADGRLALRGGLGLRQVPVVDLQPGIGQPAMTAAIVGEQPPGAHQVGERPAVRRGAAIRMTGMDAPAIGEPQAAPVAIAIHAEDFIAPLIAHERCLPALFSRLHPRFLSPRNTIRVNTHRPPKHLGCSPNGLSSARQIACCRPEACSLRNNIRGARPPAARVSKAYTAGDLMRFAVILVACLCMLLGACGSAPPAPSNGASTRSERVLAVDEYHIGVDDVVSVSVWQNPELSVTVPVRPDGRISMPLLGDVQAG